MNYLDLEDRLYTSTEVAKILGVSLRSVYRYLEDAKLDAEIKTATGRHRFTKQNIMDFLSPQLSRKAPVTSNVGTVDRVSIPVISEPLSRTEDVIDAPRISREVTKPVFSDDEVVSSMQSPSQNLSQSYEPFRPTPKMTPILDDDEDDDVTDTTDMNTDSSVASTYERNTEVVSSKTEEDTTPRRVTYIEDEVEEEITPTRRSRVEEKVEIEEEVLPRKSTRVEEVEDEEVDWLAKFRAAAEKYKAEVKASEEPVRARVEEPVRAPVREEIREPAYSEPKQSTQKVSGLTSFSDDDYEEPKATSADEYYYTSSVGGLKDIAQNLDKSATKASLDYAFTMDAGISLHKPIRPFSLIHSYVRTEDLPFFEKILGLKQVDKADAQLCLIASDDDSIFSSSKEMHGLKVVSTSQLKADLISEGKADLAKELN